MERIANDCPKHTLCFITYNLNSPEEVKSPLQLNSVHHGELLKEEFYMQFAFVCAFFCFFCAVPEGQAFPPPPGIQRFAVLPSVRNEWCLQCRVLRFPSAEAAWCACAPTAVFWQALWQARLSWSCSQPPLGTWLLVFSRSGIIMCGSWTECGMCYAIGNSHSLRPSTDNLG